MPTSDAQTEFCLPRRTREDYAREQLASAIEQLNAATDAAERVAIFADVQRLRDLLAAGGES